MIERHCPTCRCFNAKPNPPKVHLADQRETPICRGGVTDYETWATTTQLSDITCSNCLMHIFDPSPTKLRKHFGQAGEPLCTPGQWWAKDAVITTQVESVTCRACRRKLRTAQTT